MARYVVLSFDGNKDAEDFVEKQIRTKWGLEERGDVEYAKTLPEVEALIAKPTMFCLEPNKHRERSGGRSGWTQGKKYGWWVCGVCKKPTKLWGQHLGSVISQSRNLLADFLKQLEEDEADAAAQEQNNG